MPGDEKPVGVAVLGLGNVGSEVVRIIENSAEDLAARVGAPLVLRGIGVRRVTTDRGVPIELLTDDIEELVAREDVDIVVEVMGPVEPSRKAILGALERGKSVVTANKALLATSTGELLARQRAPRQRRTAIDTQPHGSSGAAAGDRRAPGCRGGVMSCTGDDAERSDAEERCE